jgi:hypothetical protein
VPAGHLVLLVFLLAIVWLLPNTQELLGEAQREDAGNGPEAAWLRWSPSLPWLVVTAIAFAFCMAYSSAASTFLYFQF